MGNLVRWVSGYGIQKLERSFTAMTCSSMKKRCTRSLFKQSKYAEWYFRKMDKCIIDKLHKVQDNNSSKMLPLSKLEKWNNSRLWLNRCLGDLNELQELLILTFLLSTVG